MPASDRPAAPRARKKSAAKRRNANAFPIWLILFAIALLAVGFFLQSLVAASDGPLPRMAFSPFHITEIMSSNKSAVKDSSGEYPDWVEIVNDSASSADITGWKLTDGAQRLVGFTFPARTLIPGERVIVYCTGELKAVPGYDYQAPFRLSAQGETLVLTDSSGAVADSVTFPSLRGNEAYVRDEATLNWFKSGEYTPGLANTSASHATYLISASPEAGDILISEVMSDNQTYGGHDYIELHNASGREVSLNGYTLTDDEGKPSKWMFADDAKIGAGEYMLLYASGLADDVPGEIHLNFKISSKGETVQLHAKDGALISSVNVPELGPDESYSRLEDRFTSKYPPTPGFPNDQAGVNAVSKALEAQNSYGVYINEAISSARKPNSKDSAFDWIELYNSTSSNVDLSGFCLTDATANPRKWAFPAGSSIAAGEYLVVYASGADRSNPAKGNYHTNFKLSLATGETLALFSPTGELVDRLPLVGQAASVSFGRPAAHEGLYYLSAPTRGAINDSPYYEGRADEVEFLSTGGYFTGGEVTVGMTAKPGLTIRYTLDSSEPDENSSQYVAPFAVSETTIVRARAFGENLLPSAVRTSSYIFGDAHTLPVVSLVSPNDYLFGSDIGIYSVGPKQLKYPFKGANFFKDWERAGNVEYFSTEGKTLLSQGVGLQLQGQYSRMQNQKAFKVTARYTYGDSNRFLGKLFPNRDYTSYKSFILRASGQDGERTRMRDAVLTSLSDGLGVMYQDYNPVVVYVNGEYWGHYNMRERIHKYSIAQWEGWTDADGIDIIKGNSGVLQGSNDEYAQFLTWLNKNGCKSDENLARVESVVDVDNYLRYVAIEMYIGNTDLLNVKRYRSDEGDGKWRWILYDTDWAFNVDTDSFRRWLDKAGAGSGKKTDNTLFVQLMKNDSVRDRFLKILSDVMYNYYRSDKAIAKIEEFSAAIEDEMPRQVAKWGGTVKNWNSKVKQLKSYANTRAKKLLGYVKSDLGWSNAQMREYFAEIMDAVGE